MKKKNIHIIVSMLLTVLVPRLVQAQVDPHFSQYYAYPLWLNPALTGVVDGDYRVSANYRNQWVNIGKPFSTTGVSFDAATANNVGVGLNIINMSAGDAGYNYLNAMASFSYRGVRFGETGTSQLVFGVQGGMINRKIDPAKWRLGSQYDPVIGFDPSKGSGENINTTSSNVFDAAAGVMFFDGNPNHQFNPFAGFSAGHITRPKDPFVSGDNDRLPVRYMTHGGTRIKLNNTISIIPNGLYLRQGNAHETVVGVYGQMYVNEEFDFMAGGNYRIKDSAIPFAGFHYKSFVLGVSYDINTSNLRRLANGSNSFEISLSFINRKRRVFSEENFFCPRL
ncbi:PorP/SprF family type IX secretion system membrane protein [Chitinophaga tropicalis]|uniref:Type IX secretion system membrane protein PorP/SprF n=1 Tax=Chitinophaga tropicalis TaxID=2683588 RepID=A0A7K1TXX4_9BACT|nr:PorP/SprF family type IX secretion system membrane protein [Chitinophaga tropicalis]MVT06951.1 type IX secretion system membrane protein PorP/SprF [Chitinophaga tropicalis]